VIQPLLLYEMIQVIVCLFPITLADRASQSGFQGGGEGFELRVAGFVLFVAFLDLGFGGGVHFGVALFEILHQHPRKHQKAFLLLLLLIRHIRIVQSARLRS